MAKHLRRFTSREGRSYILVTLLLAIVVLMLGYQWWSLLLWLLLVLLLFVFRSTDRDIPPSPLGVVSPVDGRVERIVEEYDPYLDRQCQRVTLRINPLGEYAIRAPIEGKVLNQWFTEKGHSRLRANTGGEQLPGGESAPVDHDLYGIWIQTDEQDDVVVELWLRPLPKPRCYVAVGERVGQGKRCGFLAFGGRIDLLLPANARVDVSEGDKVGAGVDIIGTLVHEAPPAQE